MSNDFDLLVIGAGSGGVRAARTSAGLGARVAIAEERYLGGTCVNVGCVPKKLFVYASHLSEEIRDASSYGWTTGEPVFHWTSLLENKNREINRLNNVYEKLLSDAGVNLYSGRATILDPHTVAIGESRYTTDRILIATGGWPSIPDIPGKEHVISSNDAFFLDSLPGRVVIAGGGYIAVEFAGIFNGLGVDTTLVYRRDLFLRGFDFETRKVLADEMRKKGIRLLFNTNIHSISEAGSGYSAQTDNGTKLETDLVMYATGRKPNTEGLGLDNVGVKLDENGAVMIDADYRTNIDSIYAIGDVTDRFNLTPVATAEGTVLANSLFGSTGQRVDYNDIPTCIFSQPNLGTVGYTEEQAREEFTSVQVYKSSFTPLKLSLTGNPEKTFMKILVDSETDRVIGVHILGPEAGEIIQGVAIAIKAGATKSQFDATIGIHPTTAEELVTMRTPA